MLETIILPITYHHMDYFENKPTASESGGAHVLNGIERTGVSSRDWSQLKDILKFVGVEIHYSTPLQPLLLNSIGPRSDHGLSISATG